MKKVFLTLILFCTLTIAGGGVYAQTMPNPVLTFLPNSPCSNLPVRLQVVDLNGVYTPFFSNVDWIYGDGTSSFGSLSTIHSYAPGNYQACAIIYDSVSAQTDTACIFFTVSGSCPPIDNFTGTVYRDLNNNGVKNVGEPGVPFAQLLVAPNGFVFSTDYNGNYFLPLPVGSYTLSSSPVQYNTLSQPAGGSYAITSGGSGATTNSLDFGNAAIPGQQDVRVDIHYRPHVPGFSHDMVGWVTNVGTQAQSGTVEFTIDPNVTFTGSFSGGTYSAGVFTVPYNNLAPGSIVNFVFSVTTSTTLQIGNTVTYTAIANPLAGDLNTVNNFDTMTAPVLSSWDPNDKAVEAQGMGPNGEINAGDELTYTIRFQNEGNFPATFIYIRDTLDPNLDWSSFRVLNSSHQMTHTQNNDQIQFYFDNIQLVPKSVDEEDSQGFVVYSIQSKSSLSPGDEMHNTASIYFDYNPAVVTNTTLNSVWIPTNVGEGLVPVSFELFPNPILDHAILRFDAAGEAWNLSISDIHGKAVFSQSDIRNGEIRIARNDLPAGTYIFQLVSASGKKAFGKMIAQ